MDHHDREDDARQAREDRRRRGHRGGLEITWTATAGGLEPGQFDLFTISAGPLPTKTSKLEFKALQTYSDGDIVRWIEPTVKGRPSPSTRRRRSRSPRRRARALGDISTAHARRVTAFTSRSTRAIADLRDRLGRARWAEAETVDDWSQGLPLAYAQELCCYWADGYDLADAQQRLNRSQFRTEIDGSSASTSARAFPAPRRAAAGAHPRVAGFGRRVPKVIGPLIDPTAHGGDAAMRSTWCAVASGLRVQRQADGDRAGTSTIAAAWAELMAPLGYDRYGAQGGDWGSFVTTSIGQQTPSTSWAST